MLQLKDETERLARKLAADIGQRPDDFIRSLLMREAKALGVDADVSPKPRMTVAQMLVLGKKTAALPLRDPRPTDLIMDDLNEV